MGGYTKLFSSIVHSTVWRAPDHVRLVWITMLALVDQHGEVQASVPGLADSARVSIEQCEDAIEMLRSPDKYSRTKANEGRRLEEVDGGWLLLNYEAYKKRLSAEDVKEKAKLRKRRQREREREASGNVTPHVTVRHAKSRESLHTEEPAPAPAPAPPTAMGPDPTRARVVAVQPTPDLDQRGGQFWPLVNGYAAMFEAAGHGAWVSMAANEREISIVARWLDANPSVDLAAYLEAWRADAWAAPRQWPWKHAAKNPARFLAPPPKAPASDSDASAERRDALRQTREAVDAARRAVSSGPDPSDDPEGHGALMAQLEAAEDAHRTNAGSR